MKNASVVPKLQELLNNCDNLESGAEQDMCLADIQAVIQTVSE